MSVRRCGQCHRDYWSYRRSFPLRSCSLACAEAKRDERYAQRHAADGPGIPAAIAELIKSHNRIAHRNDDWPDCAECERLEAKLAEAIRWHMPARAEEMAPGRQTKGVAA